MATAPNVFGVGDTIAGGVMSTSRLNTSFVATHERILLDRIVRRLPARATPDHLTAIGLWGAGATGVGFVLCNFSPAFLALVAAGLAINWFGDSLDGSLARHRKIERPKYGFLIDHSSDLVAQSMIVIGLGCSPYFTLCSSLLVLSLYLLMSSYTYLRAAVEGVHRLSYGGLGATEFRIMVALWPFVPLIIGPSVISGRLFGFSGIDVVIAFLALCTYVIFVFLVRQDLGRLEAEEVKSQSVARSVIRLPAAAKGSETGRKEDNDGRPDDDNEGLTLLDLARSS
ncbi:MAG: CDP-alcohol phosphatidyltransferase family protein [Methylocystis sp.]